MVFDRRSQGSLDMVAFWKDVAIKVSCSFLLLPSNFANSLYIKGTSPLTSLLDEILAPSQT
jgi:hypothetical protein